MLERYEKLINQGELPRLRVVPISKILLHEDTEAARMRRVAARLEQDGVLRHPPIVAQAGGGRGLLLLDGAHRVTGLKALGLKQILVQIVEYGDRLVELQRWHHLIYIEDRARFLRKLRALKDVRLIPQQAPATGSPFRSRKGTYAQIIFRDRSSLLLVPSDGLPREDRRWLARAVPILRHAHGLYRERGFLDRISYDEFDWVGANHPRFTGLVVFPHFTKEEILRVGRAKEKLPAGITRHLIPKRALRVDLPLWVLSRNLSIEELNQRLIEMILSRIQEGRIRFYSESTFSFNE
ncbi:MAG: hypothetical protein FJY88_02200 [Candidatus Eisenbacteria bacterium]|nr:hypothetical protein [Candidatus Eisenbacteria bacterium]